jgi:hypothetical protein
MKRPIWWVVAVLVVCCAGALVYSWWSGRHKAPPATATVTVEQKTAPAPAILNPVPPGSGETKSLPTLDASDAPMRDALTDLIGKRPVADYVNPDNIIRHIVVTVDNLPRHHTAVELRPVRPASGQFQASGDEQHAVLASQNYARYTPYVQVLQMLDAKMLAALYVNYYPLFQRAYQDLGYPNGYFNDRLIETIDDMLAAPDAPAPVMLVRPNVMYQFADPNLEALSTGQKLMIRIGPDNAAIVKAKLRELRADVASRSRANTDSRQR